jgi:hypothetical protein
MKNPLQARLFAAAALLIGLPQGLLAWSANGHRAVARIAQDRLTPAALRGVSAILGGALTLEDLAPCADDIRRGQGFNCAGLVLNAEPQSQPWHFVDIPISDSPSGTSPYCPGGACVVGQIKADLKTLQDPSASQADKQIALMFIVHFVGDEHQPLHCANEIVNGVNDRGGNSKPMKLPNTTPMFPLNLHSVWDHIIEPNDSFDPTALSQQLEADLKNKPTGAWTSGDFVEGAALESFQIAKDTIYPAYHGPNGANPDSSYQTRMQPIAFERLEKAGVRLAALLEQALAKPQGANFPAATAVLQKP